MEDGRYPKDYGKKRESMSSLKLSPDEILQAEYDYIAQCAFQANEDRARAASFYFVSVGSLIAAILGTQFANGLSEWVYRAFGLLFLVLTVLGVLTIFQLARLRAAWTSAVKAMNAIKRYYLEKYPELSKALVWLEPPKSVKWYSIANLLRIQVGLLSGLTFAASFYTFFRSFYLDLPFWTWWLTILSPIGIFILEGFGYHKLMNMI